MKFSLWLLEVFGTNKLEGVSQLMFTVCNTGDIFLQMRDFSPRNPLLFHTFGVFNFPNSKHNANYNARDEKYSQNKLLEIK